jgi:pantothenate kinase-related protein Tda10
MPSEPRRPISTNFATRPELLREAEAKFDRTIVELAVEEGNRLLAAGALADDLPRLMAPFVAAARQWRADAMARMHAHVARIRANEARIALNQALIAQTEACLACLERLDATVH